MHDPSPSPRGSEIDASKIARRHAVMSKATKLFFANLFAASVRRSKEKTVPAYKAACIYERFPY
eukprot:scaffold233964_cov24-Tisochrysis_lutea.AAC.1